MTVGELLDRMTAQEFKGWEIYDKIIREMRENMKETAELAAKAEQLAKRKGRR